MYINEKRYEDLAGLPVHCYQLHGVSFVDIDERYLAESPELVDLLTVDVPGAQLAGVDGLFKKLKKGIKRLGRRVKKVVKKVGRVAKKVVRAHIDVATLGVTKYHRKVKDTEDDIKKVARQLAVTGDPVRRGQLVAQINALKRKRDGYKSKRARGLKIGAVVGAVVAGPALIGAISKGAAGAKSLIGPLLAKRGMPPGMIDETIDVLSKYPPDPRLTDAEAMIADAYTQASFATEDFIPGATPPPYAPSFRLPPGITPYAPPPPSWPLEPEAVPEVAPEKPESGLTKYLPWIATAAAIASALKR